MAGENILVVDDEKIVGTAFMRELEDKGYSVDAVLDGKSALERVMAKKYDIVFIDMVMPEMNGIETCKEIKKISPGSILIFITGHINGELLEKEVNFVKAGGKVYYLYKPFAKDEIYEVVKKALNERDNTDHRR